MPQESMIVVDNTPYDCVRVENRCSKREVKAETVSGLLGREVVFDATTS
jgi:hypothetical protein